jgi:hypothetical protein
MVAVGFQYVFSLLHVENNVGTAQNDGRRKRTPYPPVGIAGGPVLIIVRGRSRFNHCPIPDSGAQKATMIRHRIAATNQCVQLPQPVIFILVGTGCRSCPYPAFSKGFPPLNEGAAPF